MPRKSNEDRILAEHPAVRSILESEFYSYSGKGAELTCRVTRPDATFMWRQGDTAEPRVSQEQSGSRRVIEEFDELFVFPRDEKIDFASNSAHEAFRRCRWPKRQQPYVRDLFLHYTDEGGDAWGFLPDRTIAVWVTTRKYYAPTEEPWVPGEFIERKLDVTVYKPAAEGWRNLALQASVFDVPVTSRMMMDGIVSDQREWRELYEAQLVLAKRIENDVYFQGLKVIIDAEPVSRGMTGVFGDITLMTYVIAGRVSVQIERGNALLNSLGAEDEVPAKMGPQSTEGTYGQLKQLVDDFIERWRALSPTARSEVVRASNASMF